MPPQPQIPQAGSSIQATDGTQLNPLAVNIAKAIRGVESGGDYNAVGDNGDSHGAYQFNKGNFHNFAAQYGLDPNDMSPTNQDKVAYARINDLLEKGRAPSEIAAIWNGAKLENGKYEAINPDYVEKVKSQYGKIVDEQTETQPQIGYQTQPSLPAPTGHPNTTQTDPSLGEQLQGRLQDASHALGLVGEGGAGNIASGAIQAVGSGAGAIGDVVNKGLRFIPGVKSLEGGLSGLLGDAANTPVGQSIVSTAQQFSQQHPELAKDIGAVGNIASVIPVFDGVGLAADAANSGIAKAFEGQLGNLASKELTGATTATIPGRAALDAATARGIDPVGEMISKKYLPKVISNASGQDVYDFSGAYAKAKGDASSMEDEYQKLLDSSAPTGNVADKIPLSTVRQQVLEDVKKGVAGTGGVKAALKRVNNIFDETAEQKGDLISLSDLNAMKRKIRESVNFKSSNLESNVAFHVGQSLQDQVEGYGEQAGVQGIKDANKAMAQNIEARNLMRRLNKKSVKEGNLRKIIREGGADVAGGAGELAGNALGLPFVGALGGRALGRGLGAGGKGTVFNLLERAQGLGRVSPLKTARTAPLGALHNTQAR